MQRYAYTKDISNIITSSNERKRLYSHIEGAYIEVKFSEYSREIENAREDFLLPEINATVIQSLVNDIYKINNLSNIPRIEVKIQEKEDTNVNITWNIDFNEINRIS